VASTVKRRVRFLTTEQVVAMHDVLLERYGGSAGGGSRGGAYEGVDAAVQAVKNSYYETLPELAASYAVYIVQGHVFLDGNKRTGAAAMLTFLEANGRPSDVAVNALAAAMIDLQRRAESGHAVTELVRWLATFLPARGPRRSRGSRRRARRQPPKA
jgi:death on curing protein